jgi:DNA topoisomerase VI subunit B
VAGALVGGPFGALVGGAIGGGLGTAEGTAEQKLPDAKGAVDALRAPFDKFFPKPDEDDKRRTDDFVDALKSNAKMAPGGTMTAPAAAPKIQLNLNIDGRTLAQAVSEANNAYLGFPTQAPAADGMGLPFGGDHNTTDK